ncbi:fumarylacetoacetate hydrolase family protein [bacterium]|nr:fumarylacetoacetate hydrolase family protein [bacterium]
MKLATLRSKDSKQRNGQLAVVSSDNRHAVLPPAGLPQTLLEALQTWAETAPKLQAVSRDLNAGSAAGSFAFRAEDCLAPLPNSPGFYDGSAFLSHVVRARKSRGDQMPESARKVPLMYQGVSDNLLAANAPLDIMSPGYGGDFEGEFAVITTDIPKGTPADKLAPYFALFTLFNDITYRVLVKEEIETKFGFLQSKPNSAFAPLVVTPDELGAAWDGKRIQADLTVKLNGELFGHPNGREMHFTFGDLVAHACRTRPLAAGSIVGTGTVSNEDKGRGFACLVEKRFQEILDTGEAKTPWLAPGDHVWIDVNLGKASVFGSIDQKVVVA